MKKVLMMISLILMGCAHQNISDYKSFAETCYMETNICKKNTRVLAEEIKKFNAAGGAFILVNLENNEVLNSASISSLKNFDYNADYSYAPKNIIKLLKEDKSATPQQFIQDYVAFIKSATKEDLKKLRNNVTKGTARKVNIDGINIYGLTATDYKLDNPDEVITTFLGHFSYQGQEYALITLLDSPKGIKSTFGFNSSGWNTSELAREVIQNILEL